MTRTVKQRSIPQAITLSQKLYNLLGILFFLVGITFMSFNLYVNYEKYVVVKKLRSFIYSMEQQRQRFQNEQDMRKYYEDNSVNDPRNVISVDFDK